jgi:5-methylcytosine-specific restriction endonuclease McrA
MTNSLAGRKQTPEHIAKRAAAWIGRKHSEETKAKIRADKSGKRLPEETKRRMSVAQKGKRYALGTVRSLEFRQKLSDYWKNNLQKHNKYKDGKYAERSGFRLSEMSKLPYRLWRESVFKRDDWTCMWCGQRGGDICADHIKPWSTHPDLRYDVSNGRTLCAKCHSKTDTFCGRMQTKRIAA